MISCLCCSGTAYEFSDYLKSKKNCKTIWIMQQEIKGKEDRDEVL